MAMVSVVAAALIQPPAWEFPYVGSAALKKKKKEKKDRKVFDFFFFFLFWPHHGIWKFPSQGMNPSLAPNYTTAAETPDPYPTVPQMELLFDFVVCFKGLY